MGKVKLLLLLSVFSGFVQSILAVENAGVPGSIEMIPIAQTIEEAKILDGKRFIIHGEFVGEPLRGHPDGWWLNLIEDGNPCAVFIASPTIFPIRSLMGGNHHRIGHLLKIRGTLRRVCPDHGGDLDFHADRVEIWGLPQPRILSSYWWEQWVLLFLAVLSVRLWYHLPKPDVTGIVEKG